MITVGDITSRDKNTAATRAVSYLDQLSPMYVVLQCWNCYEAAGQSNTDYSSSENSPFLIRNCFTFIFTYPLTARVTGAPQRTSQPVSSIFLFSTALWGLGGTPGLSIPWWCLRTSSSDFSSFPFHCALQEGFGQTWCMEVLSWIPLQFASLYDGQVFMWSDSLLDLGKDFLVGNMVFV